jgi:hypothetical protein
MRAAAVCLDADPKPTACCPGFGLYRQSGDARNWQTAIWLMNSTTSISRAIIAAMPARRHAIAGGVSNGKHDERRRFAERRVSS